MAFLKKRATNIQYSGNPVFTLNVVQKSPRTSSTVSPTSVEMLASCRARIRASASEAEDTGGWGVNKQVLFRMHICVNVEPPNKSNHLGLLNLLWKPAEHWWGRLHTFTVNCVHSSGSSGYFCLVAPQTYFLYYKFSKQIMLTVCLRWRPGNKQVDRVFRYLSPPSPSTDQRGSCTNYPNT